MNRGEILQPIGRTVETMSRHRLALVAGVTLTLSGGAAISAIDSDRSQSEAQPELLTPEQQAQADVLCTPENGEQTFNMNVPIEEEFALGTVGNDTTAVLPSFVTFGPNGEKTLSEPEEVANTILDKNCLSATLLGIFDAVWLESAGVGQEGNTFSLDETIIRRIQSNTEYFRIDNEAALRSLNLLASVISSTEGATAYDGGVRYVDDFAVTRGKAGIIGTIRNDAGEAEQIGMTRVTSDGIFEGWQIAFPEEGLTEEQIAIARAVTEKVLITPNGDVIVADWFGEDTTDFEPSDESTTPVAVTEAPNATEVVGPNQTDNNGDAGTGENSDGTNVSPTSTPDAPGNTGSPNVTDGTPTDVPSTSGPGTTGPNTTGPGTTGPNTTGPGTTNPNTTTTRPPQTTTTRPPQTTTTRPPQTTTTRPPQTTTTAPETYDLVACDTQARRPEGGFGMIVAWSGLTRSERDAILANGRYLTTYQQIGPNGECKERE